MGTEQLVKLEYSRLMESTWKRERLIVWGLVGQEVASYWKQDERRLAALGLQSSTDHINVSPPPFHGKWYADRCDPFHSNYSSTQLNQCGLLHRLVSCRNDSLHLGGVNSARNGGDSSAWRGRSDP